MLELLLSTGTTNKYVSVEYPNSGPGNKWLLAGTPALGYFGVIPDSEVITYLAYKNNLSPSLSIVMRTGGDWFKFFYKGKVIYIGCKGIGDSISWQAVYKAGGVYGINSNGPYPSGTGRNQYKPITVMENGKNWTLVPRLPHCNRGERFPGELYNSDTFEYNSLMGRLFGREGVRENIWYSWYAQWASFNYMDLDMDDITLGLETSSDTSRCIGRGSIEIPLNPASPVKTYAATNLILRGTLELEGYIESF